MANTCSAKLLLRKSTGFFGTLLAGIQFLICSMVHASPIIGSQAAHPSSVLLSDTSSSSSLIKSYNLLNHHLDSGMKVKGIKLADKVFLTRYKQDDGHTGLGLSLSNGEYLYQLGADHLSVAFRF